MKLTQTSRFPAHDEFPTFQLFFLAICRLAEPIAITSIFPYAWLMVQDFHVGTEDDASFYAGLLISAFSLTEAASGMFWGCLSDKIGRKPVLLMGCFGTMLSLLMVGFAHNFTVALVGRLVGGLLNGNIGVIQTMVGELIHKPEWEPKAYAIMPFVWSIGTILGPAIGGSLANPHRGYPSFFPKDSFFDRNPWALPNVVCASLMLLTIIIAWLYLKETHPDFSQSTTLSEPREATESTQIIVAGNATTDPGVDLRQDSYGTFNEVEIPTNDQWRLNADGTSRPPSFSEKTADKWFTRQVAMLVAALGIYTYHSMCYDHLLPIFLQDKRVGEVNMFSSSTSVFHIEGGLGLETKTVGLIMSVNGIIALTIQALIFPLVVGGLGVFRTFMMVTLLHPVAFFIVPYLVALSQSAVFVGIYFCLTIRQFLSILDYPVLLIMLKQASPAPRYLGKINGLAASVGAASRMVAPPVAGLLYGFGRKMGFTGLAWFAAGLVAIFGVFQLFLVPRERSDSASVQSRAPCWRSRNQIQPPKEVVSVTVVDNA